MERAHVHPSALPERITHRIVIGLAWPLMISMFSITATSVVDTLFVGRLGTTALASVGLALPLVYLVQSFGIGLIGGGRVAISHRVGASAREDARAVFWQVLALAVVMGIGVAALVPFAHPALALIGASPAMAAPAEMFFSVRVLAAPVLFGTFALNAWFHGNGNTRIPMVGTLICNAINVVLDPILIFGWGPIPALGVPGAALATNLGFLGSLLWLLWSARADLVGFRWRPVRAHLASIWRLGSSMGTRFVLDVAAFVVFAGMLARMGESELAAHVLVMRIVSVSFLPGHAIGEAASVLVGQAVGGRRPRLAREAWRRGVVLALTVMTLMAVVFACIPGALVAPFGPTAEVVELSIRLLWVAAAFQIFDAVAMVGLSVLNGAGDTRFAMWSSVFASWLIKLPVGAGLALGAELGAVGAWLGLTLEIMVVAGLVLHRTHGDRWLVATR